MKSPIEKSTTPGIIKFMVYAGEVIIISLLFYAFYANILSPFGRSIKSLSTLFGYVLMSLIVAYALGVMVRPVSFFYRLNKRVSIFGNVFTSVTVQATFFLLLMQAFNKTMFLGSWRIVLLFVSIVICLVLWRFFCRLIVRILRSKGRNTNHAVLVGVNETMRELSIEMNNPLNGYKIEGYFNDTETQDYPNQCEYLGSSSDVESYLNTHQDIRHLYCGLSSSYSNEILRIIDACERNCVHFYSVPEVRNYLKKEVKMEFLGSVPVLSLREDPLLMMRNRFVKRFFDIVISLLFMIPFWIIIYPLVALGTMLFQPGPVFFRQKRNGINGEVFELYKFRSMKVQNECESKQATKDDPRKTKFGNFLRRTSIDELPQFINVLKGDMSIIGPRPHMVAHTEEYSHLINKYMVRHWIRPGITGWAQVNGARGETRELWQMEDRIKKDIWYIENWSITLDIQIIIMTIWKAVVGDSQAY